MIGGVGPNDVNGNSNEPLFLLLHAYLNVHRPDRLLPLWIALREKGQSEALSASQAAFLTMRA